MKIEYMSPFIESACDAFEQTSGAPVKAGPLNLAGAAFPGVSVNVASRVSGALSGEAVCSMNESVARRLAALLTGTEIHAFGPLMREGLINLSSMWREQARKLLAEAGLECELDGTLVFQGLNVEMAMPLPALSAPIETAEGRVEIRVAVRDGQQD